MPSFRIGHGGQVRGSVAADPDVTVDCAGSDGAGDNRVLTAPRAIIEVLSPSTRDHDLKDKLSKYRRIDSVDTVAFIDPEPETLSVSQRTEQGWLESLFHAGDLPLPSLGITVPYAEIFARD